MQNLKYLLRKITKKILVRFEEILLHRLASSLFRIDRFVRDTTRGYITLGRDV